jgi:hypothetical protein
MKSRKNGPISRKKSAVSSRSAVQCTGSQINKNSVELYELGYELLPYPPYSPDVTPSDFFLFADLKKMFAGKKFSTNKEVIAKTEAYFKATGTITSKIRKR